MTGLKKMDLLPKKKRLKCPQNNKYPRNPPMTSSLPVFTSPQGETETLQAYQSLLGQWPVPYTELDVPTSFGETHIIASGPNGAPPVVLLHALFATATAWYRTVGALSQHYRTYAVDVMGEANKSRPSRPITSLDDFLGWFTELVDGLGISQMYLVGNSYGGFTAAYYAMHLPERVRKLVLIAPVATFHGVRPFYTNMFIPKMVYLFMPWLPGRRGTMQKAVNWMHAGLAIDPAWHALFTLEMNHGRMTSQVFPRLYTSEELAQIKAPTLLLVGDREQIYPAEEVSQAAKSLMPGIQVQIIPNAHHITALAQPELVNASLLKFFNGD
jgi:pimeloyl-ACP methyl ester carboxylesterase